MKSKTSRQRPKYHQTERALTTEATRQSIISAAVQLIHEARRVGDITLNAIADEAGVALRTVLRHFGTRDGIFEAAFAEIHDSISGGRVETAIGDVEAAVGSLVDHYESYGELNIKALEEERDFPLLHRLLESGRRFHRSWIDTILGPLFPTMEKAEREVIILQLYAATDVYLWKLLRRDLGKSKAVTLAIFRGLVEGCLSYAHRNVGGK